MRLKDEKKLETIYEGMYDPSAYQKGDESNPGSPYYEEPPSLTEDLIEDIKDRLRDQYKFALSDVNYTEEPMTNVRLGKETTFDEVFTGTIQDLDPTSKDEEEEEVVSVKFGVDWLAQDEANVGFEFRDVNGSTWTETEYFNNVGPSQGDF